MNKIYITKGDTILSNSGVIAELAKRKVKLRTVVNEKDILSVEHIDSGKLFITDVDDLKRLQKNAYLIENHFEMLARARCSRLALQYILKLEEDNIKPKTKEDDKI